MKKIINLIKRLLNQNFSLKTDIYPRFKLLFIWELCFLRFLYYFYIKKDFKYIEKTKDVAGYEYSKKSFYDGRFPVYRPNDRVLYLYFNLISNPNLNKENILILGPRYENEVFIAKAFGFTNVYALDTFSYSPLIKIGDIHNMNFQNNFFDAVVCGWTISYSKNPLKAIDEIKRVLKKNGTAIFGLSKVVSKNIDENSKKKISGILSGQQRFQSKEQFDKAFKEYKLVTYFENFENLGTSQLLIAYQK